MNTMLYDGKYLPVTKTIGFVKGVAIDQYVKYICSNSNVDYVTDNMSGSLDVGLDRMIPIDGPFNAQYIISQTHSEWIAVFSENGDMMLRLRSLPDSLVFGYTEDSYNFQTNKGEYGYSIFALLQPGDTKRFIEASNGPDSAWTFEQSGTMLDFEKSDYYNRRSKKKRLPFELLQEYAEHFGIRFYDDTFYGSEMRYLRSSKHDQQVSSLKKDTFESQYNEYGNIIRTYNSYHKEHGLQFGRWNPE